MRKSRLWIPFLALLGLASCQPKESTSLIGSWRGVLHPQGQDLPFQFRMDQKVDSTWKLSLMNGDESIPIDDVQLHGDSITIPMYIFDAEIKAKIEGGQMHGLYIKNTVADYTIPFDAVKGADYRFEPKEQKPSVNVEGKYSVMFRDPKDPEDTTAAIGVFHQKQGESHLTGTFLTATGDYRFLEGQVFDNKMELSAFDGTHIYLFNGVVDGDNIDGKFWSGKTGYYTWKGTKDANAALPDPDSLTYLKKGYDHFDFSFRNLKGETVSLQDSIFQNKVVIVQIMGSWCPNCMDETKFFAQWYNEHRNLPVEFVALAFEKKDDFGYAQKRLTRLKEKLGVKYPVLFAGKLGDEDTEKALPMLNHIMSYPTTIFVDKQGRVRRIHTGFSGPGTGKYYVDYVQDFNDFVRKLAAEK